jgi:hypothetical protein
MKFNIKSILPHLIAVGIFLLFAAVYFAPVWEGNQLIQSDVKQYQGAAKEITDYRLMHHEEALWTNGMFSGMPAYQISVKHEGNWIAKVGEFLRLGLPVPVGILFVTMLGFYILGMCLRIKPWIAIIASLAFGFASFNILYLGAGHLTKVNAVSFMAPTLGGLLMATRGKWLWGSIVFSFFLALNLSANHFQISYYLFIMLGVVAIAEGIRLIIEKNHKDLAKTVTALMLGTGLAILPSASNLWTTYEYAKYSTRGDSDISVVPKGTEQGAKARSGLDRSYILEYNFGSGEALSLFIPNAKGGSGGYLANNEEAMDAINDPTFSEQIGQFNQYWGGQQFSGGAIYFGAIGCFLFLISLFLLKDSLRFAAAFLAILCVLLSLKSGSLNFWFIDHFPLYNKFRDTKMILVVLQVMVPLMGMLLLNHVWKGEGLYESKQYRYGVLGGAVLLAVLLYAIPSISGSFITSDEVKQFNEAAKNTKDSNQIAMFEGMKGELIHVRKAIYQADALRSALLVVIGAALLFFGLFYRKNPWIWVVAFGGLIAIDEIGIDQRYLNNNEEGGVYEKYEALTDGQIPYLPEKADLYILDKERRKIPSLSEKTAQAKSALLRENTYGAAGEEVLDLMAQFTTTQLQTNYRVFTFENPFNETVTSFYHKSVGGYHGAKVKRYQQMVDFYMQDEMQKANATISALKMAKLQQYAQLVEIPQDKAREVFDTIAISGGQLHDSCHILNMLNTCYVIHRRNETPIENPYSNGNVWFVNELKQVKSPNEELLGLGKLHTKQEAIVDMSNVKTPLKTKYQTDSSDQIAMTAYQTKEIHYRSNSAHEGLAVFSEIYYPEGWSCTIDGKEATYFSVNYVLRGMVVPKGKHEIVWRFEPKSYRTGSDISRTGSILLLLALFGMGGMQIRNAMRGSAEEKSVN